MAYEDEYGADTGVGGIQGIEEILGPERIRQLLMTLRGAPPELQRAAIIKEAQETAGRAPGMNLLQQAAPDAFPQATVAAAPGIRGEAGSYGGSPAPPPGPPVGGPPVEQAKKGFLESIDWDRVNKAISFLGSAGLMASNRPGMRQLGSMSLANDYNTQQAQMAAKQEQQIYQQRLAYEQQKGQQAAQLKAAEQQRAQELQAKGWAAVEGVADRKGTLQSALRIGAEYGIKADDIRQTWGELRAQRQYELGEVHKDPETGFIIRTPAEGPPQELGRFPRDPKISVTEQGIAVQQAPGRTGGLPTVSGLPEGTQPPVTIEGQFGPLGAVYRTPVAPKPIQPETSATHDTILQDLTRNRPGGPLVSMKQPEAAPYAGQVLQRAQQMAAQTAAAGRPSIQYQADVAYAQTAAREAAQLDQPLGENATKWVEASGKGGFASPNMTGRQVQQSGAYVPVTAQMLQSAGSAKSALAILDQYEELSQKLLVTGTGKTASDLARVQSNRGALQLKRLAGDPDARRFDALQGTLSTMARATGDTANIAIDEKKILRQALPGEGDTKQSAAAVATQMRRVLNDIIAGKGLPVSGGGLGPAAAPVGQRRPRGRVIEE